jgi:catechol 2,3-dioxygenase-like lactoylglutathione lyase family enzyme
MKITGLFVVTLWAPDVETTAHFYRDVLELPLLPHHGARPHFKVGETLITILKSELPISQAGQTQRFPIVAFEVESLDESVQRLKDHEVEMPWGVEEDKDGRWVMLKDPAGNLVELAEIRLR